MLIKRAANSWLQLAADFRPLIAELLNCSAKAILFSLTTFDDVGAIVTYVADCKNFALYDSLTAARAQLALTHWRANFLAGMKAGLAVIESHLVLLPCSFR